MKSKTDRLFPCMNKENVVTLTSKEKVLWVMVFFWDLHNCSCCWIKNNLKCFPSQE